MLKNIWQLKKYYIYLYSNSKHKQLKLVRHEKKFTHPQ